MVSPQFLNYKLNNIFQIELYLRYLVQVLECLVKSWLKTNNIPLTEAEARSPASSLGNEAVAFGDKVVSRQKSPPSLVLLWDVLQLNWLIIFIYRLVLYPASLSSGF